MNVKKIVKTWLKENGYDGLCCEGCGCQISDLMPCDENSNSCEAGYKTDGYNCNDGQGYDFFITTIKPASKKEKDG